MKFLIQKIDNKVVHDFSFTLLESIRYQNWLTNTKDIKVKYLDYIVITDPDMIYPIQWKSIHRDYVPVGSVEFVTEFLGHFYGLIPKPINVPEELFGIEFTQRKIFNGTEKDFKGRLFVKSNDKIKSITGILNETESYDLPVGNYQFSDVISIESEWRVFVYQDKLVGLQNYSGDFTKFPDVHKIEEMIKAYKNAPIAYTLDVGVGKSQYHKKYGFFLGNDTFIIEVHDFFSCGLYGFAEHKIYPYMLYRWHYEYLNKIK